jgi:uncharacterized protein (UPF0333 family)
MQIKNKRGDISVTILVLMVVLVCIFAIFSFIYSRTISQDSFAGIGLIETVKSIAEEKTFYGTTDFESSEGNLFKSGNVIILTGDQIIEGNFTQSKLPIIGSGKKEVLVSVVYNLPR